MMLISRLSALRRMSTLQTFRSRRYSQKSINLSEPSIQKYFDYLIMENEHLLLKDEKSPTEVRRLHEIKSVVSILMQRTCLQNSIASLKDSKRSEEDEEVKKMMEEEYEIYRKRAKEIDIQLQSVLLDPALSNSEILLELVAAEGEDAGIFVKELFDMYSSYGKFKNWLLKVASVDESDNGYKRASILIEGQGVLEIMNLEQGVHHRISDKDQLNRISTVSVSVMLQPTKLEMDVPSSEMTVETKTAKSDDDADAQNCVHVTHRPTGISVTCKSNKSNKINKFIALKELNTLLFNRQKTQSEEQGDAGLIQSSKIIRTYDFKRNRVMEHREEECQDSLRTFLEGRDALEQLHDSLLNRQHYQALMNDISKFDKKQQTEAIEEEAYTPGSM